MKAKKIKNTVLLTYILAVSISFLYFHFSYAKSHSKADAQQKKITLGRFLYFDKRLSVDNTVSCNTCHNVLHRGPGADNLPVSTGIKGLKGGRNSPTVWNATFWSVQFWDGRAKNLIEQAKGPIINPVEMGMPNHAVTVEKIKKIKGYQKHFKMAFPHEKSPINIENLARAIAAFEETLRTEPSSFDRYMQGNKKAIPLATRKGYETFQAVGCVTCHSGEHFNGPKLPEGVGFYMKFPTFEDAKIEKKYGFKEDTGRHVETKKEADKHMWRVPSLRNVAITAPYFHTGNVKDLKESIRIMAKLQLNKELSNKEVNDIEAFLKSLTGNRPLIEEPKPL